jgi:hypothetical protein
MAAITPTLVVSRDAGSGQVKCKTFTATPEAASDTVDLSGYFSSIYAARVYLTAGLDADLTHLMPSVSGTTVTIVQKKANGSTNASNWTSASLRLIVEGLDSGV